MDYHAAIRKIFDGKSIQIERLYGGDINAVFKIIADEETYAVKLNDGKEFPIMFQREALGLATLGKVQGGLDVPFVKSFGEIEEIQYLVLEYISPGNASEQMWKSFAERLAVQHQTTKSYFGFESDNYIGSLIQTNNKHNKWTDFLIEERFIPQIRSAQDAQIINREEAKKIERIFSVCESLWPAERPALLHGDLWSGNFIIGHGSRPYLIDPAVYFGHREMDLGMTQLFGGFDSNFMNDYDTIYKLEKGWEDRIGYNQLYPLLVHLNLFGNNYLSKILQIVAPF